MIEPALVWGDYLSQPSVDGATFRQALCRLAAGTSIITTVDRRCRVQR